MPYDKFLVWELKRVVNFHVASWVATARRTIHFTSGRPSGGRDQGEMGIDDSVLSTPWKWMVAVEVEVGLLCFKMSRPEPGGW